MVKIGPKAVDRYIEEARPEARGHLEKLRAILKSVAPDATEGIKWRSPILEGKRILFAYNAHKTHLNFMPTRTSLAPFGKELEEYVTGKDTIQFPYGKPLPEALIRKIAEHRFVDVETNGALWMG